MDKMGGGNADGKLQKHAVRRLASRIKVCEVVDSLRKTADFTDGDCRLAAPLTLYQTTIKPEWIDFYDHMNVAYYVMVCDEATGAFWDHVHDGKTIKERDGAELVVLESHVNYVKEVRLGDPVKVTTQLLEVDDKRLRLFHTMLHATEGFVAATNEIKAIGFDLGQRRIMSFRPAARACLQDIWQEHQSLPQPVGAGQGIALKKR